MSDPITEEMTLTLKYLISVDTETGEMTSKLISRKVDKANFEVVEDKPKRPSKAKKIEVSEPQLVLEENKYSINTAATELLGVTVGDKLDINYGKVDNKLVPIISKDERGNKITKSLTVACRKSKQEALAKYGTTFNIIPHPETVGWFILKGETVEEDKILEDEEEILPLDDLIVDEDVTIDELDTTTIDSNFFKL